MPICSGRCDSTVKLVGKTAIITGCNTGIGKETALDFYKRGARVIMACRSTERAEEAKTDIEQKCSNLPNTGKLVVIKCDLSSLKSVHDFAQNILDTEPQVNILVNNAGVLTYPYSETEDGFEIQFGTNHLAHFLLTLLLLPRIKNSKPARIVTVSSALHTRGTINFDDLNYKTKKYGNGTDAYYRSKLANVLFSKELASKLKEHKIDGVNTYSLHPGLINTEINRNCSYAARKTIGLLLGVFMKSPESGAQTNIYCSIDEGCANETGLYYSDCAVKTPSRKARNDELAKKLWNVSMDLVGLSGSDPITKPDPGLKQGIDRWHYDLYEETSTFQKVFLSNNKKGKEDQEDANASFDGIFHYLLIILIENSKLLRLSWLYGLYPLAFRKKGRHSLDKILTGFREQLYGAINMPSVEFFIN